MNLTRKNKKSAATYVVYAVLSACIVWQLYAFVSPFIFRKAYDASDSYLVNVTGNVLRPGQYMVPAGTTHFEILKVAGIRLTSDISPFNLAQQITNNQQLQVGTMPNPVTLKKEIDKIRIEFFLGNISVTAPDGRARPYTEGMEINQGDRVLTKEKSQAEMSVSAFSRIDMDNVAELSFDKIGANENGKNITWLFQKSGTCWYKIVYGSKNELFRITTPIVNVTAAGNGADFTIVIKSNGMDVNLMDGQLLIERVSGTEAINLISGQTATIYGDNRPFQVSSLSMETNPAERFASLTKEKTTFLMRNMPLNFVFCGVPGVYYFGSVQYESGKIHVVNLPPETSVDKFVQGCSTLDQAFLYGGGVFVGTLIEQIMDTHIPKFFVLEKEDIIRITGALGGLRVEVDEKAASVMKVQKGMQKLDSRQLATFLKPSLSGFEDFKKRQIIVLKALYDAFTLKNIVVTTLLAQQILVNIQTNFSVPEIMDEYSKFTSVHNWTLRLHSLPVKKAVVAGKLVADPILEECKTLLEKD